MSGDRERSVGKSSTGAWDITKDTSLRRVWYTFRSPGDAAALRRFLKNLLHFAAPPTHEQPDFAESKSWILRPGGTQNPPVLLPPETVCSARKHPLSSVSGRRRYNTLDFPTENRVPTGRFHPYWKPRIQGICYPFEIPARLRISTHKPKKQVCDYRSINAKNPTDSIREEDAICEISMPHSWNGNICASRSCYGAAIFRTCIYVLTKEHGESS